MTCEQIVDFMMERYIGIQDEEMGFGVHCSPRGIIIMEKGQKLPFTASKEFVMSVVFVKYDYFLNEIMEIKKELEEGV